MIPRGYVIGTSPHDLLNIKCSIYYTGDGAESLINRITFGVAHIMDATILYDYEDAKLTLEDIKKRHDVIHVHPDSIYAAMVEDKWDFDPEDLKIYRLCLYEEE